MCLNRPEALNTADAALHEELSRVFFDIAADHGTDVVVLTGAGKAFCAGGDIKWLTSIAGDAQAFSIIAWEARRIIQGLLNLEKPVIARLHGPAYGLGATLALFCDLVFAAEEVMIADPHVVVGLVAGDGGTIIWPQLIGYARAKEYLFTGDPINASDAERMGLINRAVPIEQLDTAVYDMAERLARGATRAIAWTKATVNIGLRQVADAMLDAATSYEALSQLTADHKEGMAAFVEKRPPKFSGK